MHGEHNRGEIMTWLNWYWPFALLIFVPLIVVGVPEYIALRFGGETFSCFMANAANNKTFGKMWIMLWGLLIGGLTVHFLGWCVSCTGK